MARASILKQQVTQQRNYAFFVQKVNIHQAKETTYLLIVPNAMLERFLYPLVQQSTVFVRHVEQARLRMKLVDHSAQNVSEVSIRKHWDYLLTTAPNVLPGSFRACPAMARRLTVSRVCLANTLLRWELRLKNHVPPALKVLPRH